MYWVAATLGGGFHGSARLSKVGTIAMGAEWSGQSGDTTLVTKGVDDLVALL